MFCLFVFMVCLFSGILFGFLLLLFLFCFVGFFVGCFFLVCLIGKQVSGALRRAKSKKQIKGQESAL